MKRLVAILNLLLLSQIGISQVSEITDLPFERVHLSDFNEQETFTFFKEDDWFISSMNAFDASKTIVYNVITGESHEIDYHVRDQYRIGDRYVYSGYPIDGFGWRDFVLIDGQPLSIQSLPAKPSLDVNGNTYGHANGVVWELNPNFTDHEIIAETDEDISDFGIYNDSIYMASRDRIIVFDISDSVYSEPYAAYIDLNDLELIPNSNIDGRFLFKEKNEEFELIIHEVGRGIAPRMIPANSAGYKAYGIWNDESSISVHWRGHNISSSGNVTWLEAPYSTSFFEVEDNIYRIERSSTPEVNRVANYSRFKNPYYASNKLISFDDGNRVCAFGLFGKEGNEIYGYENDTLIALKDLYPGTLGGIEESLYADLNQFRRSDDLTLWDGRCWFLASQPFVGREICYSDGTVQGTGTLTNLLSGIDGINIARFIPDGEQMYVFAQLEDLSVKLLTVKPQFEPIAIEGDSPEIFNAVVGSYPDSYEHRPGFSSKRGSSQAVSDGNTIFYLTRQSTPGALIGDVGIPNNFPGLDTYISASSRRLQKIDALTGQMLFSKPFMIEFPSDDGVVKMILNNDSTLKVATIARARYRDLDSINIDLSAEQNYMAGVVITTFSKDGEFLSMQPIGFEENFLRSIDFFHAFPSGNMLLATRDNRNHFLLLINPEGTLLQFKVLDSSNGFHIWSNNQAEVFISQWSENETGFNAVSFLKFEDILRVTEFDSYRYQGKIVFPEIHVKDNGEVWYTGAAKGMVSFNQNLGSYTMESEDDHSSVFVMRTNPDYPAFSDMNILDEVIRYFPSQSQESEIYLQYVPVEGSEADLPLGILPGVFGPHYFHDFNLQTTQLDQSAEIFDMRSQKFEVAYTNRYYFFESGINADGTWWQLASGGTGNILHTRNSFPKPHYSHSQGYREYISRYNPDFSESGVSLKPSEDKREGKVFGVFPNPNNGRIQVIPSGGNVHQFTSYQVYDMKGRIILADALPEVFSYTIIEFPRHLMEGVYHLVFSGEAVSESHRIVLVR